MTAALHGHWSLSQVVTLLQHEFPEVTISKIRFMESQGLISPERSQSGYRHFYQGDYERLHWILVQQRDSYLPLRVIRDRLNSGERLPAVAAPDVVFEEPAYGTDDMELNLTDDVPELYREPEIPAAQPQHQPRKLKELDPQYSTGRSEPQHSHSQPQHSQSQYSQPQSSQPQSSQPQSSARPNSRIQGITGQDSDPGPQVRKRVTEGQPLRQALQARPRAKNERIDWASELDDGPGSPNENQPKDSQQRGPAEPEKPSDVSKGAVSAAQPLYRRLTPVEGTQASLGLDVPESGPAPVDPPRLPGMNTSMRADELARSAGVDPTFISDLTRFGIIESTTESGSSQYSNDTLEIVRLASEFSEFGLEPRHMRTVLLSAEREVELYAQTVGAGLRAGNAESRRQAHRNLGDLASKAASMRALMIKRMLRTLTP